MNVAEVAVNDDEIAPEVTISAIEKNEGASGATTDYDFAVGLTRESATEVVVKFEVGKAGDTATKG